MKILVAEDESIIRMGLINMLKMLGHQPIAARDGVDALEKAAVMKPELAILDIRMPRKDGIQTAKQLLDTQPLPILFLTAHSSDDLIDKATELNVQGYLVKPVQAAELKAAIAVAKKRFQDQQEALAGKEKAEHKLSDRILIDRAKGILMGKGLSEESAYGYIQQQARTKQRTMREVAQAIINQF